MKEKIRGKKKKQRQKSGSWWRLDSNQNPSWGRNAARINTVKRKVSSITFPWRLARGSPRQRRLLGLSCFLIQVLVPWGYSFYENASIYTLKTCAVVYTVYTHIIQASKFNPELRSLVARKQQVQENKRSTGWLIFAVSYRIICMNSCFLLVSRWTWFKSGKLVLVSNSNCAPCPLCQSAAGATAHY